MTLHPHIVADLLDEEAAVARERLGPRCASIEVQGTNVLCGIEVTGHIYTLRLDGADYDSSPLGLSVVDDDGAAVPADGWPPGLNHGTHPILQRPFCCAQGTIEYHVHPSHTSDSWDKYRDQIRLADLLDHLLRRAGT